jgi:hypothetical protein
LESEKQNAREWMENSPKDQGRNPGLKRKVVPVEIRTMVQSQMEAR